MTQDELIELFETTEIPESIKKEIDEQHAWFIDNLKRNRELLTKQLYLKFLDERIEKAARAIRDCKNIQNVDPDDGWFLKRVLTYRLCHKNIGAAKNEINKKHTHGTQKIELEFKDIFTGSDPRGTARKVLALLTNNQYIINGEWVTPEHVLKGRDSYIGKPLHVLQDYGIVRKKPVDATILAWCKGVGHELTCTPKAITKRKKGGKDWEAENDSEYKIFCGLFGSILTE